MIKRGKINEAFTYVLWATHKDFLIEIKALSGKCKYIYAFTCESTLSTDINYLHCYYSINGRTVFGCFISCKCCNFSCKR